MLILSKDNLKHIHAAGYSLPDKSIFELPEKVLQFGTGVLLRGLPDYFIDKANRNGIFNGRIVVVKSTDTGSTDAFDRQDGLYTIYSKGIENGVEVSEQLICSSISRVLSAASQWQSIIEVAKSPNLKIVISNTTEVGIQLVNETISQQPPASFPAKLLALLYARYKTFEGNADSGLIIIPTELIVDNGKKLKAIVIELAAYNKLGNDFANWLQNNNTFCNSLVDRIVTGAPAKELVPVLEQERGYRDELHITSEIYKLWAIEGDEKVTEAISFCKADKGVVITVDIELFRELKLRLLNGSHTLSCAAAVLAGFTTVKQAMDDNGFSKFLSALAFDEIAPAIPYDIEPQVAIDFAGSVLDRYRNPCIKHEWLSIAVQYTTKMKMRVIPLLLNHYKIYDHPPVNIALGFAAYLRFMKVIPAANNTYTGLINGKEYTVTDGQAPYFSNIWENNTINNVVDKVLSNHELWDTDLSALPGFTQVIIRNLHSIEAEGITRLLTTEQEVK
ncbi:MAG: tagaturonate reductase [Sphingobacteriales bacterium]|nr:MAG: tagaturonate reductase [Sphingobacteriales bacterium]